MMLVGNLWQTKLTKPKSCPSCSTCSLTINLGDVIADDNVIINVNKIKYIFIY